MFFVSAFLSDTVSPNAACFHKYPHHLLQTRRRPRHYTSIDRRLTACPTRLSPPSPVLPPYPLPPPVLRPHQGTRGRPRCTRLARMTSSALQYTVELLSHRREKGIEQQRQEYTPLAEPLLRTTSSPTPTRARLPSWNSRIAAILSGGARTLRARVHRRSHRTLQ